MKQPQKSLPDDPEILKAIVLSLRGDLAAEQAENAQLRASERAHLTLIEALRLRIAQLQKQKYGASSEKIERQIEQLNLALEDLETANPSADPEVEQAEPAPADCTQKPRRKRGKPRVSENTPRERIVLDAGDECPECGGTLRLIGEDVSEILEFITAKLKVVETARPKKSCRICETIVQAPAPTRPIARSMAGASLLAHILVSKYDDSLPLYRQAEILERHGVEIPRSTLTDWCGQAMKTLAPLSDLIKTEVLKTDRLHTDDTPIKVLDPRHKAVSKTGKGIKEGRIWTYVRDDRPWLGEDPPIAAYWFSPDRQGQNPQAHLKGFEGVLQADAYAGYKALYESGKVKEAACWAHWRRKFHDIWKANKSELAKQALDQIGELYDIEREINGKPQDKRQSIRQEKSKPIVEDLKAWCEATLNRVSGKSPLAQAIRYGLRRWDAFTLFLEDGCVAIDNNAAERALRPISIGRKNFLFAGSHAGGETLADAMTLIETAKLSGLNPEAYLTDILRRINDHKINRLSELLPWNWQPLQSQGT